MQLRYICFFVLIFVVGVYDQLVNDRYKFGGHGKI